MVEWDSMGLDEAAGQPSRDRLAADGAEAMFRALLEAAPDAMVIAGPDGRIVLVNRQTEALFGYGREELLGEPVELLVPEQFRRRHRGHRATYFAEQGVRPMGAGIELFGRRKDGSEVAVEISLSPIETEHGVLASAAIRDVTGRRKAEEKFRALLESAPDAMVIVATDGRIALVNRQAEHLFGYERDDLLDQPIEVLVPDRFRDRHRIHRGRYFHGPGIRPMGAGLELFGLRSDDSEFPVEISLSPIETEEGVLVAAAIRDVTDRKRAQEQLERALASERDAAEQLRQADSVKDQFLSIVSHELRTPLAAISGFTEILLDDVGLDDDRRHLLSRVAAQTVEMGAMVEQLLDFSRLEAGRIAVDLHPNRLQELVQSCIDALASALASHTVVVSVPDVGVVADSHAAGRILTNLLTNAAKFSPTATKIEVSARVDRDTVVVEVSDEGPGIPQDAVDQVFERFFQSSLTPARRGVGIGLSIAKRYAELQGGDIWVESELGAGATFSFSLPLHGPVE